MRPFVALTVVAPLLAAEGADPHAKHLEYRTAAGVTYVVTIDGLSEVHLGERTLARGGWRFRAGDARWGFPPAPDAEAITGKSIEIVSPLQARVTHTHANMVARYTFSFAGEDVRIDSWVENHATVPIRVAWFQGPRIEFGRTPRGILPNWHPTYTAAGGINLMHPASVRIGGSYAVGDGFGVGAAPHDAGLNPQALAWDWDWSEGKREADAGRTPNLYVNAQIPAGGARTFSVTFRFSPDADWKHLLEPYRRHLHATLGDKTWYESLSNLPWVQGIANGPESSRSATNPYGFDPHHRLDSPAGVINYHAAVARYMRGFAAQGLVLWGQSGQSPRNAMYRPDFDVLPPDVAPNFRRLADFLKEQGMRLGATARPGQMATPLDWTTDTVVGVDPAMQDHLELLARRFNTMIGLGATVFYLDSAGNRMDDVAILRALRNGVGKQPAIGRNVQTLVEHPSDVVVPFTGLFPVLSGNAVEGKFGLYFEGAFWLDPPHTPTIAEVMRYFYPDVTIVVMVAGAGGLNTDDRCRAAVEYCYERRMAVMVPDSWLGPGAKTVTWLARLNQQYMTPDGKWKDKPG
jgi:hypothetical protein